MAGVSQQCGMPQGGPTGQQAVGVVTFVILSTSQDSSVSPDWPTGIALGLAGTYLLAYNVPYSPSPYGITQYVILGGTGALLVVAFLYLTRIRHALMAQPKLIDPGKIVNMTGRATTDLVPGKDGVANVGAEEWTALSDQFIPKGSLVLVIGYGDGKIQVTIAPPPPASASSNEPSAAPPSSP